MVKSRVVFLFAWNGTRPLNSNDLIPEVKETQHVQTSVEPFWGWNANARGWKMLEEWGRSQKQLDETSTDSEESPTGFHGLLDSKWSGGEVGFLACSWMKKRAGVWFSWWFSSVFEANQLKTFLGPESIFPLLSSANKPFRHVLKKQKGLRFAAKASDDQLQQSIWSETTTDNQYYILAYFIKSIDGKGNLVTSSVVKSLTCFVGFTIGKWRENLLDNWWSLCRAAASKACDEAPASQLRRGTPGSSEDLDLLQRLEICVCVFLFNG